MAEADQPGKIFIGGLNMETKQKTLQIIFERFGPIAQVNLMKDWETKKSRGFAFITFHHPADAKNAVKEMNGMFLDGKKIKVEQANKPTFESSARRRLTSFSRSRDSSRVLKYGRGESSRTRSHPAREGNWDGGGYTFNFNVSASRESFPDKRGPSSRTGGPPHKRSAPSTQTKSNTGMREQESRGRETSRDMPQRELVSSRRDDYSLQSRDEYSPKDRRVYPSSRDTSDYASASREHGYRDFNYYISQDEQEPEGFSDHLDYGRHLDRDYFDYSGGGSFRETYDNYGNLRVTPSARGTYSGNNPSDDYSTSRDGYGGNRENYSNSQSNIYSSDRERSGRRERGLAHVDGAYLERGGRQERGHSPMDRVYTGPRESYTSPRYGSSTAGHGESRYESGGRNRY